MSNETRFIIVFVGVFLMVLFIWIFFTLSNHIKHVEIILNHKYYHISFRDLLKFVKENINKMEMFIEYDESVHYNIELENKYMKLYDTAIECKIDKHLYYIILSTKDFFLYRIYFQFIFRKMIKKNNLHRTRKADFEKVQLKDIF